MDDGKVGPFESHVYIRAAYRDSVSGNHKMCPQGPQGAMVHAKWRERGWMGKEKRNIPNTVAKDLPGWMVDSVGVAKRKKHKSDTKNMGVATESKIKEHHRIYPS